MHTETHNPEGRNITLTLTLTLITPTLTLKVTITGIPTLYRGSEVGGRAGERLHAVVRCGIQSSTRVKEQDGGDSGLRQGLCGGVVVRAGWTR